MKKTISFILVLAMVLCMSVTAFAAEGEQTGSTTIQAVVPAPSYTIHVPATVTLEYGNTGVQEVGRPYVADAVNIPDGQAIEYYVKPNEFKNLSDGKGNSIPTELWKKWEEDSWEACTIVTHDALYFSSTKTYCTSGFTWGIKVPSWGTAVPGTYTTTLVFHFGFENENLFS